MASESQGAGAAISSVAWKGPSKPGPTTANATSRPMVDPCWTREEPHTLQEDYTYKRPHGTIFEGQATTRHHHVAAPVRTRLLALMAGDAAAFGPFAGPPRFRQQSRESRRSTDRAALKALAGRRRAVCREQSLCQRHPRRSSPCWRPSRSRPSGFRSSSAKTAMPKGRDECRGPAHAIRLRRPEGGLEPRKRRCGFSCQSRIAEPGMESRRWYMASGIGRFFGGGVSV